MTAPLPTPGTTMLCGCGHAEWAACGLDELTETLRAFEGRGWRVLPDHSRVCPACAARIGRGDRPGWFEGWLAAREPVVAAQGRLGL